MKKFLFLLLCLSFSTIGQSQVVSREGTVSVTSRGLGDGVIETNMFSANSVTWILSLTQNNTNGASVGALTGDVTKPNGSLVTTIAAGHVVASMMANDLDTNVFSSGGLSHLVGLMTNVATTVARLDGVNNTNNTISATNDLNTVLRAYILAQINASTNDLSNNELTNKMNHGVGTNVFSQATFDYLATLAGAGSQTPWLQDINANGKSISNLVSIIGNDSTSTNIIVFSYGSLVCLQIKTNGQIVVAGPIYGLFSTAGTNANGSGMAFLEDVLNATNGLSGVLKIYTQNATNDLLATLTYTWATNLLNHRVGTNVFAQSAFDYFATLGGGGGGTSGSTNMTFWNNVGGSTLIRNTNSPQAVLMSWTESQITTKTNWIMDSSGGAKMQRISSDGPTNGIPLAINLADFGLKSSGDMTAVVQAGITEATNSRTMSVYVPASTSVYTINGTVYVPQGVRIRGESTKGTVGTGRGSTFYANSSTKPMFVFIGGNQEFEHISLYDDAKGAIGILITNESSVAQNYSIHDVTIKGFDIGIKAHYSWDCKFDNNHIINCNLGMDMSNNVNKVSVQNTYFANIRNVWLHGNSNYKNTFINNIFEAYPTGTSSNGVELAGINSSTSIAHNYFELITNGIVDNGSFGSVYMDNDFINCPYGTNIWIIGATGPSVVFNRATDQFPFISVDNTTVDLTYFGNSVRGGATVQLNPANMLFSDATNIVLKSAGAYYGKSALTNATGSADAFMSDVLNATNDLSTVLKTRMDNGTNDLLTTVMKGGNAFTNNIASLNTNQSGAAFKVIGTSGGMSFYQTNITSALTLASFDTTGCTQDHVYGFLFRVTANGNYLITCPNGTVGLGGAAPATFYSTNAQAIIGQVTIQPGIFTNVDFAGH